MGKLATTTRYSVDVVATQWTHIFFGRNNSHDISNESIREQTPQDNSPLNEDGNENYNTITTTVSVKEEDDNVVIDHVDTVPDGDKGGVGHGFLGIFNNRMVVKSI